MYVIFAAFLLYHRACNCELDAYEHFAQPQWSEYILANMERCLDKLMPHHTSHIYNMKELFTFFTTVTVKWLLLCVKQSS